MVRVYFLVYAFCTAHQRTWLTTGNVKRCGYSHEGGVHASDTMTSCTGRLQGDVGFVILFPVDEPRWTKCNSHAAMSGEAER